MACLSKDKVAEALALISEHLDQKFEGRAFLSFAGGHYMLSVRELTGIEHFSTKDPREIIERVLPVDHAVRTAATVDSIFAAYPRRRDPGSAKVAIKAAMIDKDIPYTDRAAYLLATVEMFAEFCRHNMTKEREKFIPYPATWMRRKSYLNAPPETVMRWMSGQRPSRSQLPSDWNAKPEDAKS